VFCILRISDPLVAWLVYRGELVSSAEVHERALSFWTAGYLAAQSTPERSLRFWNELELERLRREQYPEKVSRLSGFYLFEDMVSARRAMDRWGGSFRPELIAEVELRPGFTKSRHDAEWISRHLGSKDSPSWMHSYLRGEQASAEPIWEVLVSGRGYVLGKSLREVAYKVVKETWPRSMALLEVARVGVELDSDLGLIAAMICGQGSTNLEVKYAMNSIDMTNEHFLARLAAFDGPKNTADVPPDFELVLPDLRDRDFRLTLSDA
jgi:hypothetical protein